jgi:LuxR family maltose regulon positive regulatory protein
LAADDPIDEKREVLHIACLRLLHHRGCKTRQAHHLEQALDLANRLLASAEPDGRIGRVIEILALRALVYQAQGDLTRALEDLCRALTLAEPEGYLRLFVDEGEPMARLLRAAHTRGIRPGYIAKLLAAFSPGTSVSPPPQTDMIEPLTERELEVLRLIAEGLTYRQIAERLVVSVNTVRFHVKGVYGKLGVENRAAAMTQARTHGLL